MSLSAEQLDREIGLWFTNCPYDLEVVTADEEPAQKKRRKARGTETTQSETLVKRTYLCDLSDLVEPQDRHNLLLQYDPTLAMLHPAKTYYRNGRHFYFVSNVDNRQDMVASRYVLPLTPDAVKQSASFPFNPMFKLICTGFRMADVLPYLREERNVCTEYGSKIAKSIIKIAATRIFAEPEQSIVELPVNSVDSYSAVRAERSGVRSKTVGKFGMGFFSILYWLVDHDDRSLTIESFHKGQRIYCVISQKQGELGFTLDIEHTNVPTDGLRVVLNCKDAPLNDHTVEQFKKQLGKVRFIESDLVAFRETEMDMYETWNKTCQDTTNKVFVEINHQGIKVEDYAQGVSLETLLTKLFVPSVSTKTIQASLSADEERKEEFHSMPSRIVPNGLDKNYFVILIQSVAIVNIPFTSNSVVKYDVIVNLLTNVRVPVSRDDILLSDTTLAELQNSVFPELLRNCLHLKNMAVLQLALKAYIKTTTLSTNKKDFSDLLELVTLPEKIAVQEKFMTVLQARPGVEPYIIAAISTEQSRLIALLDSIEDNVDKTVFWNKKVCFVPAHVLNGSNMSNAGVSSYLFVSQKYVEENPDTWSERLALSTYTDRLILAGTPHVEKFDRYKMFIAKKVTGNETVVNVLCQIALKFQAILDMYKVNGLNFHLIRNLSISEPNENDYSNKEEFKAAAIKYWRVKEPNFLNRLSASATYWFQSVKKDEEDMKLTFSEVVFSLLDDLLFYYEWVGDLCLIYLYNFYDVISAMLDNAPTTFYGQTKPSLFLRNSPFIVDYSENLICLLRWYTETPLSRESIETILLKFPNVRPMINEHVKLTLEASMSLDQERNIVMWTHRNPYYWISLCEIILRTQNKQFREELDSLLPNSICLKELSWNHKTYFATFVLNYLKTDPGYYKFFIITVLFLELPFDAFAGTDDEKMMFMYSENEEDEMNRQVFLNTQEARDRHINYVMPNLVLFLEQFMEHNIVDHAHFVKTCLSTSVWAENPKLMGFAPDLMVLQTKLLTSFEMYQNVLYPNQSVIPFSVDDLPNPMLFPVRYHFTTSKLIDFVLKHDWSNDVSVFPLVNSYQPGYVIPLQLSEMAINEGSTKSPMEAVIIETVQNSVDAIRLTSRGVGNIDLYIHENEDLYMFKITDYVGIPQKGLLSLMIPFLSSKVASELVTGEMGSGFFNVYRGSELVIVHTTLNGQSTLVVDTPIKDVTGRVVNLDKQVVEYLSDNPKGTSIYVLFPKKDKSVVTNILNAVSFVKSVVAMIPVINRGIAITLNNKPLLVEAVPLLSDKSFDSYYITSTVTRESYLFTNGVPFLPLVQFAADLLPAFALSHLNNNILVNVHHGVYIPVQTRGKINLEPKVQFNLKQFIANSLYLATLHVIIEKARSPSHDTNMNNYLNDFDSKSSLNQVLPKDKSSALLIFNNFKGLSSFSDFIMNFRCNGHKSLSNLINMSFPYMKKKKWIELDEATIQTITNFDTLEPLITVLTLWLQSKNLDPVEVIVEKSIEDSIAEGNEKFEEFFVSKNLHRKSSFLVKEFITSFIQHFWLGARELNIPGAFQLDVPEFEMGAVGESIDAFYYPLVHGILLNTNFFLDMSLQNALRSFSSWLLNVNQPRDIEMIYNNKIFDRYFKCSFPATTFPHELEHARRGTDHSLHNAVDLQLPGTSTPTRYLYDEAATKVFQYIVQNSPFWERVIRDIVAIRRNIYM